MEVSNPDERTLREAAYAKVTKRLIPLLFLCYFIAYLDRVNVSFAKLQMLGDLKLSDTVYGLGAGIFFIGYFIFEVPSNVVLHRIGARYGIARIMISWGLISSAMSWVSGSTSFYVLRFLLGAAEAGFFPGIILYLTYWYPAERRGRITALFMTAVAVSGVLGSAISGWILEYFDSAYGWAGWQWLYLLEGIPAVLLGIFVLAFLDDNIADATWLSAQEKNILSEAIARDAGHKKEGSVLAALVDPRVWLTGAIYFCFVAGLYGIGFWLPTIISGMGVKSAFEVGVLTAVPYAAGAVGMVLVGKSADYRRERRWHIAVPAGLGAAGLILGVLLKDHTALAMVALSLASLGILTTLPLFWSLPTAFLVGTTAAAGIAFINSIGNLAGFLSPFAVGWIKELTKSTDSGMYLIASMLFLGGFLVIAFLPARLVNR
ncbi:MFS transporter [Beijerinckiaceae bacterium]|nr:MFS transporter [Beijerinckiaceae bacterium]